MDTVPIQDTPALNYTQSYTLQAVFYNLSSGHGLDKQQWNALIGIITAIVGNVLISFALNLQRYAHIRLNRERKGWRSTDPRSSNTDGHYATRVETANERSELNGKASDLVNRATADERTSLIKSDKKSQDSRISKPDQLEIEDESDDEDDAKNKKSYLKSPWWWAGIILMTIGEAGNFLAYGFAPASLVSPLGVVALISNCVIAPWLLKEKFRKRDALGVFIAVGGVVTLVFSSKGQEKRMGPDEIWSEITRWEFELYLGLTAGAMVALIWASEKYGDRTLLIDLGLVGLFGGYTALATKGIASMLSDTLWKAITFPITYLLIFVLIGTALMQIRYLNRALSRFDSTQVIPTQFVMFTISVIVGSAVLYRDFEAADAERVGKFVGGCAMTFLGVYLITSGRSSNDGMRQDESDEDEDVEEGIGLIDEEEPYQDEPNENQQKTKSRQGSMRPDSRAAMLERMSSAISQPSLPMTPSSEMAPDSPYGENPWADARDSPIRHHSNFTSSSVITDTSEAQNKALGNSSSRRAHLTGTPEHRHRRSLADIFPGPICTPLSSSLSGVIADRRRELEATPRMRRLGLRKSKSSKLYTAESGGNGNGLRRNPPSAPVLAVDDVDADIVSPAIVDNPSNTRSRSMSFGQSIGGLLGSLRRKSKGDETTRHESGGEA